MIQYFCPCCNHLELELYIVPFKKGPHCKQLLDVEEE